MDPGWIVSGSWVDPRWIVRGSWVDVRGSWVDPPWIVRGSWAEPRWIAGEGLSQRYLNKGEGQGIVGMTKLGRQGLDPVTDGSPLTAYGGALLARILPLLLF